MNEELTKERDQLLIAAEGLRETLNKATAAHQEIEAQRDSAFENISQVYCRWNKLLLTERRQQI